MPPLMPILIVVVCALAGYLVGSIPFGYLIVRAVKGVDLRSVGSGRTGGTNAYRAAGLPAGIAAKSISCSGRAIS